MYIIFLGVDVNECLLGNGGCQGDCVNLPGSYICSCGCNMALADDGKSCLLNVTGNNISQNHFLIFDINDVCFLSAFLFICQIPV